VYNKGQSYSKGSRRNPQNPFLQAIKSAGAERGYYSTTTLTGERILDGYDKKITEQETLGLAVLEQLRSRKPISLEEKIVFSIYIDLMMDRVPSRAIHAAQFVERAMQEYPWDLLARKAAEEGRFDLAQKLDPSRPENVAALKRQLLLEGVVRRSQTIVKKVASMTWQFYFVGGRCVFPTTDNPAFHPLALGLNKNEGFIMMPIDSQLTLLISNMAAPDRAYLPATTKQYHLFRNTILSGATSRAYACRKDRSILARLNKPRYG